MEELFHHNLDLKIDKSWVNDGYLDEKEHVELKRPGEVERKEWES